MPIWVVWLFYLSSNWRFLLHPKWLFLPGANTVTVQGPSSVTKVKMEATLYQKKLIGREEISTMSASSNSARCSKSQSAAIEKGKTYVIEVTAQVYSGGAWDTIEETITVKT